MKLHESPFLLALVAALAAPLSAQDPEPVLKEDSDMPGMPGMPIDSLQTPTANGAGGWAIAVNYDNGVETLSAGYGSKDTGPAAILFEEGTYGIYDQSAWEFTIGISNTGQICYSPTTVDTVTLVTGIDAVWVDATPVAVEDLPIASLPGKVWRFASRPGITANGIATWVGGINDASGTVEGNGLFFGIPGSVETALLISGQSVLDLPYPLQTGSSIDFDYRFSPTGNHHILAVDTQAPSSSTDFWMVKDGVGLKLGGLVVGEGEVMPVSLQKELNEPWGNFDRFGISDDGSFLMTGDTGGDTATDEFLLVVDDETDSSKWIQIREGDTLDGKTLKDIITMAYMSAIEDVAFVMETDDGTTTDPEVLFFNGRVLMEEGQAVDFDGDGFVDPTAIVRDFTGTNALAITTERVVYVTADVDTLGTSSSSDDTEVLFRITVPDLAVDVDSLSLATGGTASFRLYTRRDVVADLYFLLGSTAGSAPGLPVDGLVLPLNFDPYLDYTLKNPNSAVLVNTLGAPGSLGAADAQFVLPTGQNPALAGATLTHAFATIETAGLTVSSVSNAVDFVLVP